MSRRYRYYYVGGGGGGCCRLLVMIWIALALFGTVEHHLASMDPAFVAQETATEQTISGEITQTIKDYYDLVKRQDYTAAYTYFDHHSLGLPFLTQECYLQTVTQQDRDNGAVISVSIQIDPQSDPATSPGFIDPNQRSAEIQVIRSRQTQQVTMSLQHEGQTWKIIEVHPYLC